MSAANALQSGLVIPAHPLALDADGRYEPRRQRALTRYYHAAGAGGLAVGVHTTQFEIREHGLFETVLREAAEETRRLDAATGQETVLIGGAVGQTEQAVREAGVARDLGYHAVLLSLAALPDATDAELERHCRAVADVLPVFGFYLQPAVGGRRLGRDFWRRFAQIPGIAGIKIAPFDRYATLDVIRGLAEAGRLDDIPLYTGNDDTIVQDLLTPFDLGFDEPVTVRGGLLGHWACWTRRAVDLLERCKRARESGTVPGELLKVGAQVTDMNAALFDTDNGFAGAIAGVNEVLRRQGLLSSARCLAEHECLSPGQPEALDRVTQLYPHLTDDAFINAHLDDWLNR